MPFPDVFLKTDGDLLLTVSQGSQQQTAGVLAEQLRRQQTWNSRYSLTSGISLCDFKTHTGCCWPQEGCSCHRPPQPKITPPKVLSVSGGPHKPPRCPRPQAPVWPSRQASAWGTAVLATPVIPPVATAAVTVVAAGASVVIAACAAAADTAAVTRVRCSIICAAMLLADATSRRITVGRPPESILVHGWQRLTATGSPPRGPERAPTPSRAIAIP